LVTYLFATAALWANPDISQKYEKADISKRVANTLLRQKIYKKIGLPSFSVKSDRKSTRKMLGGPLSSHRFCEKLTFRLVPEVSIILNCTALPRVEFFIEPPSDTQRRRRRGERGIGVTKGSYLLLTNPSPLPPTHCAPAALPGAALSGHTSPPLS
jgi:hypothetical protein